MIEVLDCSAEPTRDFNSLEISNSPSAERCMSNQRCYRTWRFAGCRRFARQDSSGAHAPVTDESARGSDAASPGCTSSGNGCVGMTFVFSPTIDSVKDLPVAMPLAPSDSASVDIGGAASADSGMSNACQRNGRAPLNQLQFNLPKLFANRCVMQNRRTACRRKSRHDTVGVLGSNVPLLDFQY